MVSSKAAIGLQIVSTMLSEPLQDDINGPCFHIVIPDYARMHWLTRAPTAAETAALTERVKKCFEYVVISSNELTVC